MALTINGKRTGKASHGADDLDFKGQELTREEELQVEIKTINTVLMNIKMGFGDKSRISELSEKLADLNAQLLYGEDWEASADALRLILENPESDPRTSEGITH